MLDFIPKIYIISYKNDDRRNRMMDRFSKLNLLDRLVFTPEVNVDDIRLLDIPDNLKRTSSITLQHIDSLIKFLETTNDEYCIVCEDDIHISKLFSEKLGSILYDFKLLNLDILLLGYILTFQIDMNTYMHQQYFKQYNNNNQKILINYSHTYHHFPNDIWGSQMYLISRNYAKFIVKNYNITIENNNKIKNTPKGVLGQIINNEITYNPDWIITKNGNRAIIYPMLALEEKGNVNYDYSRLEISHFNPNLFY